MEKKKIIKRFIMVIIGTELIGLGIAIIKFGPMIVNKIKKKMACRNKINIDDLPEEEPTIVWEECEEG